MSKSPSASGPGSITALILARGGSKGIPRKNLYPLNGVPLIAYSVRACVESQIFESTVVSTDDTEIAGIAEQNGAEVFWRDVATATDTASSESAILDFVKNRKKDSEFVCLVQATSPLTRPDDFKGAWELFRREQADSLVTVVRWHRFFWKVNPITQVAEAKNYDPVCRPRRQEWDGEMMENGAFYLFRTNIVLETGSRLGGKMVAYEMPEDTACELDSLVDLRIMENLLVARES